MTPKDFDQWTAADHYRSSLDNICTQLEASITDIEPDAMWQAETPQFGINKDGNYAVTGEILVDIAQAREEANAVLAYVDIHEAELAQPKPVVITKRPPIIPEMDYVFEADGAQQVKVLQGTEVKLEAVRTTSGVFVLSGLDSGQLQPGATTFLCSAFGKPDWSLNVKVAEALPDEF